MDIGLGIALLAGFLSFASPCVLPIVPGYLTFITGMSFEQLTERQRSAQLMTSALIKSVPFVCGFSLVFIALGASASAVSGLLRSNLGILKSIAGTWHYGPGAASGRGVAHPGLTPTARLFQRACRGLG